MHSYNYQQSRRGGPPYNETGQRAMRGSHSYNSSYSQVNRGGVQDYRYQPQDYRDGLQDYRDGLQNYRDGPQSYPRNETLPPPPSLHQSQRNSAPVQLTVTIDPEQLMPNRHLQGQNAQPYDYYKSFSDRGYGQQINSPQSCSFNDDRPPPYTPPPAHPSSYSTRIDHGNTYNPYSRGGHSADRLPSPPPPYQSRQGILATPQSQDMSASYPYNEYRQDMQSQRRIQQERRNVLTPSNCNESNQHFRGRGRGTGRGKGNVRGNLTKNTVGSISDLSDIMPLGCEASMYKKKKFRNKDNSKYDDGEVDDGEGSIQSMPVRGNNNLRGGRGRGGNRRGGRGGKTGRPTTKCRGEDVESEDELEDKNNSQARDAGEEDDGKDSIQIMSVRGKNNSRGGQRGGSGGKGSNRTGGMGERGGKTGRPTTKCRGEDVELKDELAELQDSDSEDSNSVISKTSSKSMKVYRSKKGEDCNKDKSHNKKSPRLSNKTDPDKSVDAPYPKVNRGDGEDKKSVNSSSKSGYHYAQGNEKNKQYCRKESMDSQIDGKVKGTSGNPKTALPKPSSVGNKGDDNVKAGVKNKKSDSVDYPRDVGTRKLSSEGGNQMKSKKKTKKEDGNFQGEAKRLDVFIKMKKSFTSGDELKKSIEEAFEFPNNGQFKVDFSIDPLLEENSSSIKFGLLTNNVWMANKCVKNMIGKLRRKLKTYIHSVSHLNKPKGSNVEKEFEKSKEFEKHGEKRLDLEVDVRKSSDEGKVPDMCPVKFRLFIEKPFALVDGYIDFITTILNDYSSIEDFQISQDSIILSKTSSECVLDLKSKADSRRLKKTLLKFQKETKLEMRYEVDKIEMEAKTDEEQMKNWNSRIDNILKKMEDKKNAIVNQHDEKLSSLRRKREILEQAEEQNEAEMNAVQDKLAEAFKQKVEFGCRCKAINKRIQEIKLTKTKEQDLRKIQEDFGVECNRLSNALPIYARCEDIISHVKSNQVSIILGETGSGKSTQIAQYLHEAGIVSGGVIVCTQPRKVAAVQLADRVAQEMGVNTGGVVGYKTGNKRKVNDSTKVLFMTDHSLLNECLEDRDFQKYSCIIVDEAHERSIYTDILLGMIKACLVKRQDLRVVITSATIDPQVFINYFQCPREIRVSGRTYPVEVFYVKSSDDFENYEAKAVSKAAEIHRNEAEGDILVFLTSPVEIQRCCEEFCKLFKNRNDFKCFPLHGQLLPDEQKKVFARLDQGVRKVVFATNCAETSITIDGIKYVIDTGVSKEMRYDAKKNLNLLGVHMISQSSADQRKGRAGRTASGKCYRLFSEEGYSAMRAINEPEILCVHLGQAILKLAELGVNIRDYDFVEAPSTLALQSAIETLEYLGAIKDGRITDLGLWVSKLPFEPKLGYVVYKAYKDGLVYDAIVLASVISNGSGIFYRGLTETEAQISARSKALFGLESGDIFTWLTIYKIWEGRATSKERRQWCQSNCINYKSMNYTKTCIDDTIVSLQHELKVEVEKQFSEEPSTMTILSKLILRAYGQSLCHFMGHSRAGYFSLFSERQVHFHPSCTLAAQNLQPEWVVFVELVKTSREFIKGILVVDEEWIQEAVNDGHFDVNIPKAKAEALATVHREELGGSIFRAVVGPQYSNLQVLEEMCEKFGMKHPILEADRGLGAITIYSSSPTMHSDVLKKLNEIKCEAVKKLENEESECKIFNKDSNDLPNIRAVLGSGGLVRQVLMPHQTTEVLLRRVGEATEEDILGKFSEFGNILELIQFKNNEPWGFLRYRSVEEALIAVERTKQDESIAGSLRRDKVSENNKNMFSAKVSWLRRPVKGDGTAFIKVDPMDKACLLGKDIFVNGALRKINLSKKEKQRNLAMDVDGEIDLDLIVFKIGETTEEELRDGLLAVSGRRVDRKRITIPRVAVPAPSQQEVESIKTQLKTLIDPHDEEKFTIWISKPQTKSVNYTAFLYFSDPVRGFQVCKRRNKQIRMGNHYVNISPSIKTTILIPKNIKSACKEQMDELFINMERDLRVQLEWKKLKEDHAVTIKCDNAEGIVKARECITNELKGDVKDCNVTKTCLCLLSPSGQDFLQQTQKKTGCVIISDKRTKKIHIYGKPSKQSEAQIEINKYLGLNESKIEKIFKLKGLGKPQGLMKALMNKFGPLLDGLNEKFKFSSVTLDCRTHTLKCSGSEDSINEFEKFVSSLENRLFESNQITLPERHTSLPECVVCMDNVETKEGLYRLEACGHPYCIPCLQHQIISCVQSNQFPLVCAEEHCGKDLVWKDLRFILAKKWIKEEKLIHSSLHFLVSTKPLKYKFCPTPNCPVVYEATLDEAGCEFNCAACFASTCSTCHLAFHAGVSCKMAKSESNATSYLDEWCKKDPDRRKICPNCKSPIEKTEGCNKMRCGSCGTVFCWLCLEVFEDSQKCYAHLVKKHGAIY